MDVDERSAFCTIIALRLTIAQGIAYRGHKQVRNNYQAHDSPA